MKTSTQELAVGSFVLLGLALIAWFTVKFASDSLGSRHGYDLKARFTDVGGLRVGSPVMIAGVTVGKVRGIVLDARWGAVVDLRLDGDVRIPTDSIASVRTSGLIGDKFVALSPGADDQTIAPGGLIAETESSVNLESLISRMAFGSMQTAKPNP